AKPTVFTTYYLTETSSNTGCSKTDSVKISINPLPNKTVRPDTIDCSGAPILVGGAATKGDKYSWVSVPAGFTSNLSNPAPTPTTPTSYLLTETITATGCQKTDTVKISITPSPK